LATDGAVTFYTVLDEVFLLGWRGSRNDYLEHLEIVFWANYEITKT